MIKVVVSVMALFCCCGLANGQALSSRPIQISMEFDYKLTSDQLQEVDDWLPKMRKWHKYDQEWLNQIPKGLNGSLVKRKQMPAPPDWLPAFCASYGNSSEIIAEIKEACTYLARIHFDPGVSAITQQTQAARANAEKLIKGSFLSHVHLDGLWTQPQIGNNLRVYGLIGAHISLVDIGRIQFYGPPGILFFRFVDQLGTTQYRAGYTWGMSVKLADFHFPGSHVAGKGTTLYINLVKAWIPGLNVVGNYNTNSVDMAGFSITPKKMDR